MAESKTGIRKRIITMKEIGLRIFERFGERLELKRPPAAGFRVPAGVRKESRINITKFPDDFDLDQSQENQIKSSNIETRGQSTKRYLEVVKILNERQGE